tara:strand:- start:20 stop:697 length:678 start_codon:yes stop_codon:yes gene_type:complete
MSDQNHIKATALVNQLNLELMDAYSMAVVDNDLLLDEVTEIDELLFRYRHHKNAHPSANKTTNQRAKELLAQPVLGEPNIVASNSAYDLMDALQGYKQSLQAPLNKTTNAVIDSKKALLEDLEHTVATAYVKSVKELTHCWAELGVVSKAIESEQYYAAISTKTLRDLTINGSAKEPLKSHSRNIYNQPTILSGLTDSQDWSLVSQIFMDGVNASCVDEDKAAVG